MIHSHIIPIQKNLHFLEKPTSRYLQISRFLPALSSIAGASHGRRCGAGSSAAKDCTDPGGRLEPKVGKNAGMINEIYVFILYMYIYTLSAFIHMYIYIHMCIYTYICVCVCVFVYVNIVTQKKGCLKRFDLPCV